MHIATSTGATVTLVRIVNTDWEETYDCSSFATCPSTRPLVQNALEDNRLFRHTPGNEDDPTWAIRDYEEDEYHLVTTGDYLAFTSDGRLYPLNERLAQIIVGGECHTPVSVLAITAADYNGQEFDEPPFRCVGNSVQPWCQALARKAISESLGWIKPNNSGCRDYLRWDIKDMHVKRYHTLGPGDYIVFLPEETVYPLKNVLGRALFGFD